MFSVKSLFYTYLSRMQIGIQAVAILALISGYDIQTPVCHYECKYYKFIACQIVG